MFTYTFQTPDHSYDFVPDPLDPESVIVKSEYKDSIEEFIGTLELAGVADGRDFSDITIREGDNGWDVYPYIQIHKADLALFLQFEVLNYMGVPNGAN